MRLCSTRSSWYSMRDCLSHEFATSCSVSVLIADSSVGSRSNDCRLVVTREWPLSRLVTSDVDGIFSQTPMLTRAIDDRFQSLLKNNGSNTKVPAAIVAWCKRKTESELGSGLGIAVSQLTHKAHCPTSPPVAQTVGTIAA